MVEAEQLCDRIAIVDRGRILALGTPEELRRRVQAESIFRHRARPAAARTAASPAIGELPGVLSAVRADEDGADGAGADRVALKVALADDSALTSVVTAVAERGSHLVGLAKSEPSLEDVFVELVGRGFGDEDGNGRRRRDDATARRRRRTRARRPSGRPGRVDPGRTCAPSSAAPTRASSASRREPSWLFFEIFLPFLAVSAFVFVYRALEAPEEFIGFVVLGGAMTAFWLNVVWMMAAQFYWEKDQGNLELYFTAPMHLMSILAGMAIGGLVMTSSRALAVIAHRLDPLRRHLRHPAALAAGRRLLPDDDPALRARDALRVACS